MIDPTDTVTRPLALHAEPPPAEPVGGEGGHDQAPTGAAIETATEAAPQWRRALEDAVTADPRGRAGVGDRLGVSRVYVSRVLGGGMSPVPVKFIDRVVSTLCRVDCPHLGRALAPSECRAYASRAYRALDAAEVAHWRACQRCPNKAPPEAAPTSSFGADAADRAAAKARERAGSRSAAASAATHPTTGRGAA